MSTSFSTMAVPSAFVTQLSGEELREAPKCREDRIRDRAGDAWDGLPASGKALARSLRRDPSNITLRKRGLGHFAGHLIDVDALERDGHDTTPFLVAYLDTVAFARADRGPVCPLMLAREEDEADRREDEAETAWLTGSGSLRDYIDAGLAVAARWMRNARLLGGVA